MNRSVASLYEIVTNATAVANIDLQAIFNSFPHSPNHQTPGGGTLLLNGGIYYTGGADYYNTIGDDSIKIKSMNGMLSCLVFTNNSGINIHSAGGDGMSFEADGVVFASTVDSNYFLIHIQNNNRTIIQNCVFTPWQTATNNNGLGLEFGLAVSVTNAPSLGGVWYDGVGSYGDVFDFHDNNLNALANGLLNDGNHLRFDNNFIEACGSSSKWPTNDVLGFGGGIVFGRTATGGGQFFSFSGKGNHWFDCGNAIVIANQLNAANEIRFIDSQFENSANNVVMLTNSPTQLFLDGITWGTPGFVNYATNAAGFYYPTTTAMTALVNHGVGVSIVTTPQFLRTQKTVERKSSWTSEQFIGRIAHYQKLPDSLSESDLNKVAVSLLPEGNATALEILVRYAQGSAKYLAGIESVVCRARYMAGKDGRAGCSTADIKKAVQDSVIPSDSALARAIAEPEKPSRKRIARALQRPLMATESPLDARQRATEGDESIREEFTYRRHSQAGETGTEETPRARRELIAA